MKFLTLMKKEFREILPWMLFAAIAFLAIGFFNITLLGHNPGYNWQYSGFEPGLDVDMHQLLSSSVLGINSVWLFLISIAFGLAIGIRQFWVPFFKKTWAFEFHRSVNRRTVLIAKLLAGIIAFLLALGTIWTFFYIYSSRPDLFMVPTSIRNFLEGWILIALGFLIYLATALTALARAHWYTTKAFGLPFAIFILSVTFSQWKLSQALITIIIGIVLLLSQIIYTFLNREF